MIRTSDGGLTWARQQINTTHDVTWLAAFSPNEALLRADRLYRTTDGGNSWVALPNPTEATITDLAPASTDVVWASAGNVLATTDGGASWQELNIAASAVDAVDERHAWALGSQVWRTTDGGGHWQGLGGPSGARDLDFVSATRGWLLAPIARLRPCALAFTAPRMEASLGKRNPRIQHGTAPPRRSV